MMRRRKGLLQYTPIPWLTVSGKLEVCSVSAGMTGARTNDQFIEESYTQMANLTELSVLHY